MHGSKLHGLLLTLLGACACASAQTAVDFNSVTSLPDAQIPNGYAGFDWTNFYVASPALLGFPYNASGYENGLINGQYVGFNGYGNPGALSTIGSSDTLFGLKGYFTAGWTNDDQLTIEAIVGNNVVQSFEYGLSETKPKLLNIRFAQGVNEIEFVTFSPSSSSSQMVLDDLTINPSSTPEPASLAALGLGIGGLARANRRRVIEQGPQLPG